MPIDVRDRLPPYIHTPLAVLKNYDIASLDKLFDVLNFRADYAELASGFTMHEQARLLDTFDCDSENARRNRTLIVADGGIGKKHPPSLVGGNEESGRYRDPGISSPPESHWRQLLSAMGGAA